MSKEIIEVLNNMNNYYVAIIAIADILYGYKCDVRYSDNYDECLGVAEEIVRTELHRRCVENK